MDRQAKISASATNTPPLPCRPLGHHKARDIGELTENSTWLIAAVVASTNRCCAGFVFLCGLRIIWSIPPSNPRGFANAQPYRSAANPHPLSAPCHRIKGKTGRAVLALSALAHPARVPQTGIELHRCGANVMPAVLGHCDLPAALNQLAGQLANRCGFT
jgi:hypothetical protein